MKKEIPAKMEKLEMRFSVYSCCVVVHSCCLVLCCVVLVLCCVFVVLRHVVTGVVF